MMTVELTEDEVSFLGDVLYFIDQDYIMAQNIAEEMDVSEDYLHDYCLELSEKLGVD